MVSFLKKAFSITKKFVLVVLVFLLIVSLFSIFLKKDKTALATNSVDLIQRNRDEIYKTINDPQLKKTTQGKITIAVFKFVNCKLIGEACTDNPVDGNKNFSKSSLGFISNLMVIPFVNPPASGLAWTYTGLQLAGFVPKTYAAEGIGMGSIQPFAKVWVIFRDVTYLLLVLIIIVIGFMVMFRAKINPQTVISVENSLPRIVIALVLITFSFAIAGFMIDLMYVVIAIIVSILSPVYNFTPTNVFGTHLGSTGPQNAAELQKYYLTAGLGALYKGTGKLNETMWWTVALNLPNKILGLIPAVGYGVRLLGASLIMYFGAGVIRTLVLNITQFFGISQIVGSLVGNLEPGGLGASLHIDEFLNGLSVLPSFGISLLILIFIMSTIVPIILGLVIWFSLIFVFFRLVFMLFESYIKILLSIILAPIYLIFEAIPGQSAFSNWIKNLAGELITFPLIVGIFVLGTIIADNASSGNLVQFPFMVGIDSESFGYIIGMGLLFMTPDLVKAVRQVFIPKPGLLDGMGPGVFFGGATTAVGGGLSEVSKVAGLGFYIAPVQTLLSKLPFGDKIFAQHGGGGHPPSTGG